MQLFSKKDPQVVPAAPEVGRTSWFSSIVQFPITLAKGAVKPFIKGHPIIITGFGAAYFLKVYNGSKTEFMPQLKILFNDLMSPSRITDSYSGLTKGQVALSAAKYLAAGYVSVFLAQKAWDFLSQKVHHHDLHELELYGRGFDNGVKVGLSNPLHCIEEALNAQGEIIKLLINRLNQQDTSKKGDNLVASSDQQAELSAVDLEDLEIA
ncbi:hypothetical protein Cyrtocomes_00639 [Candidatus Cyrtobacter comes]|uniref:DUF697 domain-containing protein n=2 Tax=Candidatus Cyrtobacter comes TaxID=675776 RepID=A0ABU5L814_9RICK|nr:hypothetical protein [Candidatus Cyrtobacter comes]